MQAEGEKWSVAVPPMAAAGCPGFGPITRMIRQEDSLIQSTFTALRFPKWVTLPEEAFHGDCSVGLVDSDMALHSGLTPMNICELDRGGPDRSIYPIHRLFQKVPDEFSARRVVQ